MTCVIEGIKIQMSAVKIDDLIRDLKADRYISFNVLMGSLAQLKKSISLLEERITREGDNINFSVNSDILENSMHLWKASHKIYQIDSTITQLTTASQKNVEAIPVCAGDTRKDDQGGNMACDLNATETKP